MIRTTLLTILFVSGLSMAQQADTTKRQQSQPQITTTISGQTVNLSLKKQTGLIVRPKSTTNWSKIKDLFL